MKMATNNMTLYKQCISEKQKSTHENTWSERWALNIGIRGIATISISKVFFLIEMEAPML